MAPRSAVIASDSDAIQTKRPPQSLSLDFFALLAMTSEAIRLRRNELSCEGASGSGPSRLKSKRPPRDSVAGVFLASRLARVAVPSLEQFEGPTARAARDRIIVVIEWRAQRRRGGLSSLRWS